LTNNPGKFKIVCAWRINLLRLSSAARISNSSTCVVPTQMIVNPHIWEIQYDTTDQQGQYMLLHGIPAKKAALGNE
jgi:hypothetical protein